MNKNNKIKILNCIKKLNALSARHTDLSYELHQLFEKNKIEICCDDGYGRKTDQFPDWFVGIIDYGQGKFEDMTVEMLNKLIEEMKTCAVDN